MLIHCQISEDGIQTTDEPAFNWLVMSNPTFAEEQSILEKYGLPEETFQFRETDEVLNRFERLSPTN